MSQDSGPEPPPSPLDPSPATLEQAWATLEQARATLDQKPVRDRPPPIGLLHPSILRHLTGVIDLKAGQAVRAVAGERDGYRPIQNPQTNGPFGPTQLAQHYLALGLRSLYIADLDGLTGRAVQWPLIQRMLDPIPADVRVLIDIGWTDDEQGGSVAGLKQLLTDHGNIQVIAATESASSVGSVGRLAAKISANRVVLSLDYRGGVLTDKGFGQSAWLDETARLGLAGVIVLDTAAVGLGQGPVTPPLCRQVRSALPHTEILSGGGVRDASDMASLLDAGCDSCLVATALLGLPT